MRSRSVEERDETGGLVRFSISMPARLLQRFDQVIQSRGYTSRSEAVRDLVRDRLVEAHSESRQGDVVGALAMVYGHETRSLGDRLTHIQHHAGPMVISSMHVHLGERDCLEVLALRGPGREVRALANRLLSLRGVKHGKLTITGTGEGIPTP